MKIIYLAYAGYNYEGSSPIRAFESEADAEAFVVPFRAHMEREPVAPQVGQWHDEAVKDAWHSALREWEKVAPADFVRGDSYYVDSIELH